MNPFRWPFRAQCLLAAAVCAGLLGYAFYVQFELGLEPCPFCIFQRLAFAATGLIFLLAALHGPRSPVMRKIYGMLAFLAAAIGAGYAARHSWLQLFPPEISTCGASVDFMLESQSWLGVAGKVLMAKGDCSTIDWQFLGLTMPMWCLIWFVALALWALWVGFSKRKSNQLPAPGR